MDRSKKHLYDRPIRMVPSTKRLRRPPRNADADMIQHYRPQIVKLWYLQQETPEALALRLGLA